MKVGILGGGQLGRMLLQAAANYVVDTYILENDVDCPAAHLCHHFVKGSIRDFDTVYRFGKDLDAITIEIESVNVEALEKLESEGVTVIPKPSVIKTIQNKISQKEFYLQNGIPSADFIVTANRKELAQHVSFLPAVHKIATGGYDGKGVQMLEDENDVDMGFDAPSVLEKKVAVKKELSVIVAHSQSGELAVYPAAEMIFNPQLNLLDYQLSPAIADKNVLDKAEVIAKKVVEAFASPGLFAVEIFVDGENNVWVNETAPRVHNSGHHTIEANYSSQYDMLWRILLGYPLGNTAFLLPSAIVNLIGEPEYSGKAVYHGLNELLELPNVFVHLYGKSITKPGRKMGHVTILNPDYKTLTSEAVRIKNLLKIES